MDKKKIIRKNYFIKRKKNYFTLSFKFFSPLINLIKSKKFKKKISISLYFPTSYEADVLRIMDIEYFKKFKFLLPIIEEGKSMNFYQWEKSDILTVNKYGVPEPIKTKKIIPDIILVPLLAFDKNKNRLGYGKGFYDKFFNRYVKTCEKILSIGIAFSFQEYQKLPKYKNDFELDYIITEKGIVS